MTQKNLVTQNAVPEKVNDEESEDEDEESPLKKQFLIFVKHKDQSNPGTHILLSQSDFWMKHAGVLKGKKITATDTGVCFFKFKKYKLSYPEYLEFLQNLADYKNIKVEEIIEKMVNCEPPPAEIKRVPQSLLK